MATIITPGDHYTVDHDEYGDFVEVHQSSLPPAPPKPVWESAKYRLDEAERYLDELYAAHERNPGYSPELISAHADRYELEYEYEAE